VHPTSGLKGGHANPKEGNKIGTNILIYKEGSGKEEASGRKKESEKTGNPELPSTIQVGELLQSNSMNWGKGTTEGWFFT